MTQEDGENFIKIIWNTEQTKENERIKEQASYKLRKTPEWNNVPNRLFSSLSLFLWITVEYEKWRLKHTDN